MTMKKLIGNVTPEEKEEIQHLYERRNGLNELAKIVTADNDELYEKLVKDLGETGSRFQTWWDRMASKYEWEGIEDGHWEINFDTCEIFLVGGNDDVWSAIIYWNIRVVAHSSFGFTTLWRQETSGVDAWSGPRYKVIQRRYEGCLGRGFTFRGR